MSPLVLVLILGLAVAQATRLWRDEEITEPVRDRVLEWFDPDSLETRRGRFRDKIGVLLDCPWCLSGWLAIFAVVGTELWTDYSVPLPGIIWLAVWRVAVFAYWLVEVLADQDEKLVEPPTQRVSVSGGEQVGTARR